MTYGWETTTDELLEGRDIAGQRILITGASAGLGQEAARALAAHGANIVMAVRDAARASERRKTCGLGRRRTRASNCASSTWRRWRVCARAPTGCSPKGSRCRY